MEIILAIFQIDLEKEFDENLAAERQNAFNLMPITDFPETNFAIRIN